MYDMHDKLAQYNAMQNTHLNGLVSILNALLEYLNLFTNSSNWKVV